MFNILDLNGSVTAYTLLRDITEEEIKWGIPRNAVEVNNEVNNSVTREIRVYSVSEGTCYKIIPKTVELETPPDFGLKKGQVILAREQGKVLPVFEGSGVPYPVPCTYSSRVSEENIKFLVSVIDDRNYAKAFLGNKGSQINALLEKLYKEKAGTSTR